MWAAIKTLVPSIGLLFLLYLVLRHMMEADRRERVAQARWEEEHKRPPNDTVASDTHSDSSGQSQDS